MSGTGIMRQLSKQRRGALTRNLILGVAMICMIFFGYQLAGLHMGTMQRNLESMRKTVDLLRDENTRLRKTLNESQVETTLAELTAQEKVVQELALTDELKQTREKLGFYQNVMAPEVTQEGFLIEGVQVQPTTSDHIYRLKFVLLQQRQNKAIVKGNLHITLQGSINGEPASLESGSAAFFPDGDIAYRFKFFQTVEQPFSLPENFVPDRLVFTTQVYQYASLRGEYSRSLSWSEALENSGTATPVE